MLDKVIPQKARKQNGQIILTMFWIGLASFLNLVINISVTSLVTNSLGAEAYGYVTLANNFITYATILTSALNSYATRYISIEYYKNKLESATSYFNSVLFTNLVGGGIILIVFVCIIFRLEYLLVIPSDLILDVKILFTFMFLNFYALLIGNTFLASVYIKNRLDLMGIYKAIAYFIEIIMLYFVYLNFKAKVWYVGLGYFISSGIIFFSAYYVYKKLTPDILIHKKSYSVIAVKKLVVDGIWNAFNSLGNALNSGLDLLISNRMLSPLETGQISIAKTIGNVQCLLYQLVSQAFQPTFLRLYAEGNKKKLVEQLQISMKISGVIAGTFFVGVITLGKQFYQLWTPNQDIDYIYNLTVITLASYVLEGVVGPLYYIYTLTVKIRIPCLITIIGGICNVIGMIILLSFSNLGGYAIVGTTTVIMIFINMVTNPIYMTRCLKVKWFTFYPTIFRFIAFNIVAIVVNKIFVFNSNTYYNWLDLIMHGIFVCVICGLLFYLIVLTSSEKKMLIHGMKKIRNNN